MRRKQSKTTRGPNADELAFQGWLKIQECATGGSGITEVHHCKGSTFKHNKVLIGHWFCIPLGQESHNEYHAGTKAWREYYGSQANIWVIHLMDYAAETGKMCPDDVYDSIVDWGG